MGVVYFTPRMAHASGPVTRVAFLQFTLLGGCMPCMYLWQLSLRRDFPQPLWHHFCQKLFTFANTLVRSSTC